MYSVRIKLFRFFIVGVRGHFINIDNELDLNQRLENGKEGYFY